MTIAYPSLTREGYVSDLSRKVQFIFRSALASDKSQDPIHPNGVTSIQWVLAQYSGDDLQLQEQMQNALEVLFNKYFDKSIFTVEVKPIESRPGRVDVRVKGELIHRGYRYSFGRQFMTEKNVISDIKEINYS
jgi:hypothetical protein